jgi:hypothetical protein
MSSSTFSINQEVLRRQALQHILQRAFVEANTPESSASHFPSLSSSSLFYKQRQIVTSIARENANRHMLLNIRKQELVDEYLLSMLLNKKQALGTQIMTAPLPLLSSAISLSPQISPLMSTRVLPNFGNTANTTPPPRYANEPSAETTKTLLALGSRIRKKTDPYVDAAALPNAGATPYIQKTCPRASEPFPEKLYRMLQEVEQAGKSDIVTFHPHGRAFGIHNPERFVQEIMPKFFKHNKIASFARQLSLYGFLRITTGPDSGAYYHELFLKGRPHLCMHMRRVGLPKQEEDRRKCRPKQATSSDPDLYSMRPVALTASAVAPPIPRDFPSRPPFY